MNLLRPLAVAAVLAGSSLSAEARDIKLRALRLGHHMKMIADEARASRWIGGSTVLLLATGAGIGAAVTGSRDERLILGLSAGLFGVVGTATLLFPTDFETVPERYAALPADGAEAWEAKVSYGETALANLAEQSRRGRIWGGITSAVIGGAYLATYAADTSADSRLYAGLVLLGLGVATAIVERTPETEHEAYRRWLGEGRTAGRPDTSLRLAPLPLASGAGVVLHYSL